MRLMNQKPIPVCLSCLKVFVGIESPYVLHITQRRYVNYILVGLEQHSSLGSSANDALNVSTVNTELSELRSAFKHQSSKINLIELNIANITNDSAALKSSKDQMLERLDNIEYGLNDTRRQAGDTAMGQSEISIKVKKLETSVQSIGDTMQSCLTEYTTKDTFSKFMENCFDQIKTVGVTVEAAKYKGTQVILSSSSKLVP